MCSPRNRCGPLVPMDQLATLDTSDRTLQQWQTQARSVDEALTWVGLTSSRGRSTSKFKKIRTCLLTKWEEYSTLCQSQLMRKGTLSNWCTIKIWGIFLRTSSVRSINLNSSITMSVLNSLQTYKDLYWHSVSTRDYKNTNFSMWSSNRVKTSTTAGRRSVKFI